MHTVNLAAFIGVGFLAIGAMFCVTDLMLFDNSYVLLMGPILWIVGCALMVAWAVGRVALSMDHDWETHQQTSPRLRQESGVADTAAAGSGRGAVA